MLGQNQMRQVRGIQQQIQVGTEAMQTARFVLQTVTGLGTFENTYKNKIL